MINYKLADMCLNLFYGYLPYGANYYLLTYSIHFEENEWEEIFDFLLDNNFIENRSTSDGGKHIITQAGIDAITKFNGIENFLKAYKF